MRLWGYEVMGLWGLFLRFVIARSKATKQSFSTVS